MKGKSKPNPFDNLFATEKTDTPLPSTPTHTERTKGKKSNKNYVAAMTYLPKQLRLDVQQQILDLQRNGIDIDFSELVAELLLLYLDIQKGNNSDSRIAEFLDSLQSRYSES